MTFPAAAGLAVVALAIGSPPADAAFRIILSEPAVQQPEDGPAARPSRTDPDRPRLGPPPASAASGCTAVVRQGDSLVGLAKRHLGDGRRWREIQALNQIRDPDLIGAGWKLALPCDGFTKVAAGDPERDPRDPPPPVPQLVQEGNGASPAISSDEAPAARLHENAGRREGPSEAATEASAADGSSTIGTEAAGPEPPTARPEQGEPDDVGTADDVAEARTWNPSPDCSVKVSRGDTLATLARRHLGDPERWPEISALNSLADPDRVTVGQVLLLPCGQNPRIAGTAPVVDGPAKETPVPGTEQFASVPWSASAGELLDDVISRWANEAGWTALVTERWYWVLDTDVSFSGTFLDSVEELLSGFSSAGQAPGVTVYANRMLVLEYR